MNNLSGKIRLKNAIKIHGRIVNELEYDAEKITVELYEEAGAKANSDAGGLSTILRLGMAAVIAVNPDISFEDLERVTGGDIKKFSQVGGNFMTASDEPEDKTSDEQSETTQELSTQA